MKTSQRGLLTDGAGGPRDDEESRDASRPPPPPPSPRTTPAMDTADPAATPDEAGLIRSRVANACDGCKARKVKCDGKLPCSYCTRRRRPHTCKYSPPRQRRHPRPRTRPKTASSLHSPSASAHSGNDQGTVHIRPLPIERELSSITAAPAPALPNLLPEPSPAPVKPTTPPLPDPYPHPGAVVSAEDHEEAEVPLEARLLCDAQGKLIFIGDCAPLSFFQTVRQLVTSRVDPDAFAPHTSRYSVLENVTPARSSSSSSSGSGGGATRAPDVDVERVPAAVAAYLSVTSGLVDLFPSSADEARLAGSIAIWASGARPADDVASAVNYLVLALGTQQDDEGHRAQAYFDHARERALATLNGSLGIETVQAFILVTLYMLCACQINGAFVFFGIAVRAAYSIGVHRTEVNSRFGPDAHRHRDRIWKSLRVVDLFLSTSMGRPPCVSDVDCTVPYRQADAQGRELFDLLNASVQIFLILEGIVLEVYSRRKITFQLTEGISRQLRDFSVRWLRQLKKVASPPPDEGRAGSSPPADVVGACQVLATYYYAVMLVSRPFLVFELHRRLSPEPAAVYGRAGLVSGKSKLADACIDAASMMVDQVLDLIEKGAVTGRRPVLVAWLFSGSLVLGAGLLGGFGRVLERYARMSSTALDHFAKIDAHAAQYAIISKSLLATALDYLEKKEVQERLRRTESSAQLFGLLPPGPPREAEHHHHHLPHVRRSPELARKAVVASPGTTKERDPGSGEGTAESGGGGGFGVGSPSFFGDLDPAFLDMSNTLSRSPDLALMNTIFDGDESSFGGLNLFPLLETDGGGHIDLAHYL